MLKLFSGNKSFFDLERKKIEKSLTLPLLELVLEHLPHLQATIQQQDDIWEMIAIKLNNHQFVDTFVNESRTKDNHDEKISPDELPTLNGVFIKELYEKIMNSFESGVQSFNWNKRIYRANVIMANGSNNQGSMYLAFNLPIKEAYTSKEDIICCELFYMKSLTVETQAQIARQKLIENLKAEPQAVLQDIKSSLEVAKTELNNIKLQSCLQELDRKNHRIETLDKENKRLMELNQELLDEVNQLRSGKFN